MTGSTEHAWAIAVLGCTVLISTISNGQLALGQGLRRIADLALANVPGVLVSTLVAISLYAWLGQDGIVPVMVATAVVSLGLSYWVARKVPLAPVKVPWRETVAGTRRFARLGVAFMWSGVLTAGLDMLTRSVIARQLGLDAAGIYQAAWALSGLFAGFILGAMGADFYPRLTAVIHDKAQSVRMVNEQTEIGILLALPGLLATLAFASWAMEIFYTRHFLAGADLLPWMVLGVFGRVISWPMGFIQLAMGASRWYLITETVFAAINAALLIGLVETYGVIGAAYAFALTYSLYVIGMIWVGRVLIGFRWSRDVIRLLLITGTLVGLGVIVSGQAGGEVFGTVAGGVLTAIGGMLSVRGLVRRLGANSSLGRLVSTIPGGRWVIGL